MANFTAGTSFTDGVTNDVTAAKLNALVADAVPTANLSLNSTTGTVSNFTTSTATINGPITASTAVINVGSGQIYKDSSGNVGIGTVSPTAKLHLNGLAYSAASAANSNAKFEVAGGNGLGLGTIDSTSSYASWIQSGYLPNFATATYNLLLQPLGGNVGVGETSPTFKMEIVSSSSYLTLKLKEPSALANLGPNIRFQTKNASGNYWDCGTISVRNTSASMTAGAESSYMSFYTATAGAEAERLRINSSGYVGINTTTIDADLHIRQQYATAASGVKIQENASASKYYRLLYTDSSGVFRFNNGSNEATITLAGSFVNASDSRLKKDITDIKYGLNEVMESKPRSFSRVDVVGEYFGFIAQELQNILPEAVSGDSESQLGVDYGSLVAVAFRAIQELKSENDTLKSRIEALEAA